MEGASAGLLRVKPPLPGLSGHPLAALPFAGGHSCDARSLGAQGVQLLWPQLPRFVLLPPVCCWEQESSDSQLLHSQVLLQPLCFTGCNGVGYHFSQAVCRIGFPATRAVMVVHGVLIVYLHGERNRVNALGGFFFYGAYLIFLLAAKHLIFVCILYASKWCTTVT